LIRKKILHEEEEDV